MVAYGFDRVSVVPRMFPWQCPLLENKSQPRLKFLAASYLVLLEVKPWLFLGPSLFPGAGQLSCWSACSPGFPEFPGCLGAGCILDRRWFRILLRWRGEGFAGVFSRVFLQLSPRPYFWCRLGIFCVLVSRAWRTLFLMAVPLRYPFDWMSSARKSEKGLDWKQNWVRYFILEGIVRRPALAWCVLVNWNCHISVECVAPFTKYESNLTLTYVLCQLSSNTALLCLIFTAGRAIVEAYFHDLSRLQ